MGRGVCIFLTGLSGSGKTTIANALQERLESVSERSVTLLDGDSVRKHLSSELGFSKEHRELNILRIGFVASEIVKHGGLVICAAIAPYMNSRKSIKKLVGLYGNFVLVHISTPLGTCEGRDVKGLYARARSGLIDKFTGVSDPYEEPEMPSISIDTTCLSVESCVTTILNNVVDLL